MSKRYRTRVTVTLEILPGGEPWILVKGTWGWFKLPGSAPVAKLVEGALAHWQGRVSPRMQATTWVLVRAEDLDEVRRLRALSPGRGRDPGADAGS